MVTTCSKNMSSLPSVMRTNPWPVTCNLFRAFGQQGLVRFKTNLETQSVNLASTKPGDTHNVQQVALSADERNWLQADLQLLEAYVQTNMEGMRRINQALDGIVVEMETVGKATAVGKQCLDRLGEFTNRNAHGSQLSEIRTNLQSSINVGSAESTLTRKEPNPKRKQRWIELNETIQRNARQSMTHDSIPCSQVNWDEVEYLFHPLICTQPRKNVDDEKLEFLHQYLSMTRKCFVFMTLGGDAKNLHFIAPILFCVCNLFDGDVDIVVEENVVGNFVKAESHFAFMLRRGKKAVCIVQAKKQDIAQATADALVGCEVVAEVEGLDIVYGIVTDYIQWSFLCSRNDKVEKEFLVLRHKKEEGPKRETLKKIVETIYSMLSSEDTQG